MDKRARIDEDKRFFFINPMPILAIFE